ncbi:cysteine peptidase family C39 domain-containing protein [Gardnerella sp. KA01002]|uniref:cysteine peptidase family C39 domain-containing protein n=1 Tax=Gardnerella sp. KA01002 TaxID=2749082 RepID=UPI003BACDB0C
MVAYPHNMQNLTSDCGIAVIKSLLENYHRFNERSFKSVVSSLDIEQGLSLFNIEEVLKQFGVYGSSDEVEDFHLLDFTKPMILLVDSNGENHYILLYGVKDGKAIVSDPSHVVLEQVNLNELKGVFKGYVFIIENVVERTHQEKLLQKHSHVKKNLKLGAFT